MSDQEKKNQGQDAEPSKKSREVSGWGPDAQGRDKQDFSDIANPHPVNPEFRRSERTKEDKASE